MTAASNSEARKRAAEAASNSPEPRRKRGRPPGANRPAADPVCARCGCSDAGRFYRSHRSECRDCRIELVHGLPVGAYRRMLADQGGVCWICGDDFGGRHLYVDHCHETGAVRGLLCNRCNSGLAFVERHRDRLDVVLAYLERAREAA